MAYVSSPNNADDDVSSSAALLGNEMGIQKDVSKNEVPNKSTSSTNRRYFGYGSTGTISTYLQSFSSSSPESSTTDSCENNNSNSHNKIHRLGIDLNAIEDSDESSAVISINSTYSDISSDGGGYYNRFARHRQQLLHRSSKYFFLTANNFKVALSLVLWFLCYMIMGVLGGSVAYMHFPRTDADIPKTLPDFGYDIIPYSCPRIPHVPHGNVQSVVLFFLYSITISGVILRWKPRYHPRTNLIVWGGDGRLILQQLCHLNCLIFLTRTSTVGLTGMPQPNPKCTDVQHLPVTFGNAMKFVIGRGFPPHACGDLIYSGHVGCTLICMAVLHRNGFLRNKLARLLVWIIAFIGIYFTISCRSHYSVDVMLAFYFGYFLPEWYYNRSDGRVGGKVSRWIRWLEVRTEDLEMDEDDNVKCDLKRVDSPEYPTTINV